MNIIFFLCLSITLSSCGGGRSSIDFTPHVTTPFNLQATTVSASSVYLSWNYDGPADATQVFHIYANGEKISSASGTTTTVAGLLPDTRYCFNVTSKNIWYESALSNTSCVITATDTTAPYTFDANLVARLMPDGQASLRWNQYFDNVAVSGYRLYRNGVYFSTITDLSFIDSSLSADTQYCYYIIAFDISGNESAPGNTSCVDSSWKVSDVQTGGEVSDKLSIAVDSANAAHIVFYDRASAYLRYTSNASGAWTVADIDYLPAGGYKYNSIVIDSNDYVHIAYHDPGARVVKYATNSTGDWVISQVDSDTSSGAFLSMAIDSGDKLHLSYYTSGKLSYLTNSGGAWVKQILDSTSGLTVSSIAVSPAGYVHIAYYDYSNKNIVYMTNMTGSWVKSTLTSFIATLPDSSRLIAVDANDSAHLCYTENAALKYLTNSSGEWLSVSTGIDGGAYCSIALSSDGFVHISHQVNYYRSINQVNYSFIELAYTTNRDSSWKTYVLDDSVSGWYSSLDVDSNNDIHIASMKMYDYSLRYATTQ